jgi:acetyl esterase/lipase
MVVVAAVCLCTTALGLQTVLHSSAYTAGFQGPVQTANYKDTADGALAVKVQLPANGSNHPAVIIVPGTGWGTVETPKNWDKYALAILDAGFALVQIDIRDYGGKSKWPDQGEDLLDGVRFLKSSGSKLGINPERLSCYGSSSGAHACAYLGTKGAESKSTRLNAVVNMFGPMSWLGISCTDHFVDACCMGSPAKPAKSREAETETSKYCSDDRVFGFEMGTIQTIFSSKKSIDDKIRADIESADIVNLLQTVSQGKTTPTFTAHGTSDVRISIERAKLFNNALEDYNVDHKFVIVDQGEHCYNPSHSWKEPLQEAVEWITKYT